MIMAQLANLISSVSNWDDLNHKIETTFEGWVRLKSGRINIVEEIQKIPGLKYSMRISDDPSMYNTQYYVEVTDQIGNIVELYLKSDGFAGLSLGEFIEKII